MSNFFDIIKYGFSNAFTFQGRVSRSVYFVYFLTLNTSLSLAQVVLLNTGVNPWLVMILTSVISIVLGFSIMVRRVHDAGHGWKLYLLFLIPFIGPIIFLIFTFMVDENDNKYGLFSERKVTSLDKNIVTIIIVIFGLFMFISTAVSTGIAAKLTQETLLEVQDNAQASSLASNLEMIGNQAKVESFMESDGVLTVELLQRVLTESNLPSNFVGSNTETGIMVTVDGIVGRIDIDPSSDAGFTISIG